MNLHKTPYTVGDIFRGYFDQYLTQFGPLPKHHYAVANSIMRCRTEEMGGHIYRCDSCNEEITLYNSCRNRHCPQCQALARARWVEMRMKEALPVHYFHVVFTIPHQLNPIVLRHKKIMYTILFKAVAETLVALGKDSRFLGGEIGFISILHTWGQNLLDHPHIHCIVPAGALDVKNNTWRTASKKFLFPVAVMRKIFRAKFMDYFRKAVSAGDVKPLFIASQELPSFDSVIDLLYTQKWVVYVKKPFTTPINLIKYSARYINRIAIANQRIIEVRNDQVTFLYKDYADNNQRKIMTISAVEFIRRFMLHIIPEGFMRIRQYGFLGNAAKKKRLPQIRQCIEKTTGTKHVVKIPEEVDNTINSDKSPACPFCKKGKLIKNREVAAVIKQFYKIAVND